MARTGRFGSLLFLLLAFVATLSGTGYAATKASAGTHAAPPVTPTRFARASAWVLGLEGLLNLTYTHSSNAYSSVDGDGNELPVKSTTSSLSLATFTPKMALDGFVIDHLSVGVAAGFSESNFTSETSGGGGSNWSSQTTHVLDVTPRVGFAYVASGVGVWIRGGLGIRSQWNENAPVPQGVPDGSNMQIFDTHLEVLAAFMARRDIVVSVGPWITKIVASSAGDGLQLLSKPEDQPPVFGLALGAGLVL
jgi:hypothetical protein